MQEWPTLAGRSFNDVMLSFADAVPVGVVREGTVLMNPPLDFVVGAGDEIIVLAEDDDTYEPSASGMPFSSSARSVPTGSPRRQQPEKLLFCAPQHQRSPLLFGFSRDATDSHRLPQTPQAPQTDRSTEKAQQRRHSRD